MRKPVVHLYTVCWDEADMLGFFFRHYGPWVDRFVVYDDGSTDGSLDILKANPKVELRAFDRVQSDSFVLSHKAMQDEAWKESRGRADWVVVTAIDEHLHVKGRGMAAYLAEQAARGTTMIPALGFDMHGAAMPEDRGLLTETVTRGRPRSGFNKLSIFDPDAVAETGFGPGRHAAEPVGRLQVPARDEVMLWHYKHLGFQRNAEREAAQALRLGAADIANGFGQHYLWPKEQLRAFWDEMEREGRDLAADGFEPDRACARPLWWRSRVAPDPPGKALAAPTPASHTMPTVSVVIKAYNHAAYVRQTIESVLSQSFQDFEIVATDDGSTDGTLDVLRSFGDRRIHVEALPENRGISAAMNAAVARARGRYLAILNSDDWALPGRLQKQVAFLDSNAGVSLVFGLPRFVDEAGEPTAGFNNFRLPLGFPDFSRRTWLRQFFFGNNCLCAPTAMVRRSAYEEVGPYDPRLALLGDLDMWLRMLIAGHDIHVLADELTAFRIRDGNANMSAPRPDSSLRHAFELTKVLTRFTEMDARQFEDVFGDEAAGASAPDAPVALRVAELAQRNPSVICQNFALETLYKSACSADELARLRSLTGSVDALGTAAVAARDRLIKQATATVVSREREVEALGLKILAQEKEIAAQTLRITEQARQIAACEKRKLQRDLEMAHLRHDRAASLTLAAGMRNSSSWRLTSPMRWVGRLAKRVAALG